MKKTITISILLLIVTIIPVAYYIITFDNSNFAYQIFVRRNQIDLNQFGLQSVIKLTGNYERDVEEIYDVSNRIVFETNIVLDSNGLPSEEDVNEHISEIIPQDDADIYSVYMADLLTKFRFCYGSKIILNGDSLYNSCIHVNPLGGDADSYDNPYYSVVLYISKQDSFCISKKYNKVNKIAYENICFQGFDLLEHCGASSKKYDYSIYKAISENYDECRIMASSENNTSMNLFFAYQIVVDRNLPVNTSIKKMIELNERIKSIYGYKEYIQADIKGKSRVNYDQRRAFNMIQWQVK